MMELILESSLLHQLSPINGVATVVEASIKETARASHQNPVLSRKMDATALKQVRSEYGILIRQRRSVSMNVICLIR